ncbi:MAG: S8 family peptidase [Reichenbachiella sp.]|uniref:S8 family peptidase n=1 Tax=Reichenbachiella sp. TaxID=2184521 RepID=UPI0032990AF8
MEFKTYQTLNSKQLAIYSIIVEDPDHFIRFLNMQYEAEVLAFHKPTNALNIECAGRVMQDIVNNYPQLGYVGLSQTNPEEESSINYMDLSTNRINTVHSEYAELIGNGVRVSIKEQFMDTTDIDLKGRYFSVGLESEIISQHANFMATMIAGAGNTYHLGRGVAPYAGFTSSDFTSVFPDDDEILVNHEISIQNHSYGFEIDNRYSPEAQAYDHQSYLNPELLHVLSSGNKGLETSVEGNYANVNGFANLSGSHKMTKNGLIVGATDKYGVRDDRSSVGPTFDGRIKPDLMAYGQEGSSDAAALASGVSILIQDWYKQNIGLLPSSSLVKAVLIAGAVEYEEVISFKTGYGELNGKNALDVLEKNQLANGAVDQDNPTVYTVEIPPNIKNLRVVLCWTDVAGVAGAGKGLMNDLDLSIVDPNDQVWQPWVLSHFSHEDSLSKNPVRIKDSINNVELITLENPEVGIYTFHITSQTEMTSPQNFSLAYQLEVVNNFEWTFPTSKDVCLVDHNLIFRWDTSWAGLGKIELKEEDGSWLMLTENYNLDTEYFEWVTDKPYAQTQLRMTTNGVIYLSDEFNLVKETPLFVGFNCEDDFKLTWPKDDLAVGYELYELQGDVLGTVQISSDTFLILSKSIQPALNYAIRPLYKNHSEYKSRTIDYAQQGVNCYYKTFVAELVDDAYVSNSLSLTSISDINRVDFYNYRDGTSDLFASWQNIIEADLSADDLSPSEGVNNYYGQIGLKDGRKIQTDTTSIYFATENTLVVFPNSISKQNFLNVLTGQPGATLQLLNTRGDLLHEEEVFFDFIQIPIERLSEGIYILRLYHGDNNISHAKLIVTD